MRRGVILLCACILSACSSSPAPAEPDPNVAFIVCRDAMQAQLRAPATAAFASLSDSTVTETADQQVEVRSHVDAQNGFGATIRMAYTCIASPRIVENIYTYDVVSLTSD